MTTIKRKSQTVKTLVSFPKAHDEGFLTISSRGRHQSWKPHRETPQAPPQAPVAKIALVLAVIVCAYAMGFYSGVSAERREQGKAYYRPKPNPANSAQPAASAVPAPTPATVQGGNYHMEVSAKAMTSSYIRDSRGGCFTYTSGGNKRYVNRSLCN